MRLKGARPQSNRFLKETLAKLADDSARIGRKFVEDGCHNSSYGCLPASPSVQFRHKTPLALPEQLEALAPQQWEADGAGGVQAAQRLPVPGEDVAGDVDVGAAVLDGVLDDGSPRECTVSDIRDAMLAVADVLSTWANDISGAAGAWAKHIDEQYTRYSANIDRWDVMKEQVNTLQEQIGRLESRLEDRAQATDVFREGWQKSDRRIEHALQSFELTLKQVAKQSDEEAKALQQSFAKGTDSVTTSFRRMIYGPQDQVSDVQAIEPHLQVIQQGLQDVLVCCNEDVTKWQAATERLQTAQELARSEVELARSHNSEAEGGLESLRREIESLNDRLKDSVEALKEARHAPAGAAFERIKEIEKRGKLKVNRQCGLVEVTSLDFAPVKVGNATADWKDKKVAGEVLQDVAELVALFDGPVSLEYRMKPGKGGKPDFWERVAQLQAEFLKAELSRIGVPELSLMVQGQPVQKNQEPGVVLTLKRGVFDDAAIAALAAAADQQGKKPAGKR